MSIVLEQLLKRYDGHPVVNQVSLEVADGEFFVLLGPSGSGKSTVLRMIAGLTSVDGGRVLLRGKDVTLLPPQKRGVGFVFQNYALFRHMSVAENIEFGLRIRGAPAAGRRRRREELLEMAGLAGLGGRMPSQLSGGQQQRVALARALAHRPEVLLLDEPFGALDARIRVDLRRTVRAIQRDLRITTIFVTHDQDEAFELADRVGVQNFGRLLEVGPPDELYLRPQTEFVATFLGTANLMVGEAMASGVRLGPRQFALTTEAPETSHPRRVQVLFRPEDVALSSSAESLSCPVLGDAEVLEQSFAGSFERLRLRLPSLASVRAIAPPAPYGSDAVLVDATRSQHESRREPLKVGSRAWVGVRRMHALTHPGLSFLLLTDGSPPAEAALAVGAEIARLAHARVTVLGHGREEEWLRSHLQKVKEMIGGGLAALETRSAAGEIASAVAQEAATQQYDLVIAGLPPGAGLGRAESIMAGGDHHLLLVPGPCPIPWRPLVCVAVGEPGKEDVLFTGRLTRHLGARATLLTILPEGGDDAEAVEKAERFLAAGARTVGQLGVPAEISIRRGPVREEILSEMAKGAHDLLVLGAPLTEGPRKAVLDGIVASLLNEIKEYPVMIVRSW